MQGGTGLPKIDVYSLRNYRSKEGGKGRVTCGGDPTQTSSDQFGGSLVLGGGEKSNARDKRGRSEAISEKKGEGGEGT